MTVNNLNLPIYRDLFSRLFPKMENRDYCSTLTDAYNECKDRNYLEHPPCKELLLLIKKIECLSNKPRPLYPIKKYHGLETQLKR